MFLLEDSNCPELDQFRYAKKLNGTWNSSNKRSTVLKNGSDVLQECTAAIRMTTYEISGYAVDEYLKIGH